MSDRELSDTELLREVLGRLQEIENEINYLTSKIESGGITHTYAHIHSYCPGYPCSPCSENHVGVAHGVSRAGKVVHRKPDDVISAD